MIRVLLSFAIAVAPIACTSGPIGRTPVFSTDVHVRVASPQPGADSGVALLYDARVCTAEIFDGTRTITWRAPPEAWDVQSPASGATLIGIQPLPPGHYELVRTTQTDRWSDGYTAGGAAMGDTGCSHRRTTPHVIRVPFDVSASAVTIVVASGAKIDFMTFRSLSLATHDPLAQIGLAGWLAQVDTAVKVARATLIASRRERHDGYDVYRDCDGITAVVRETGTPFADAERQTERDSSPKDAIAGMSALGLHVSGSGAGCVHDNGLLMIRDDDELEHAAAQAGGWLVDHDLQGEIDIEVGRTKEPFFLSTGMR